jgi:uncharacterized protein YkwD
MRSATLAGKAPVTGAGLPIPDSRPISEVAVVPLAGLLIAIVGCTDAGTEPPSFPAVPLPQVVATAPDPARDLFNDLNSARIAAGLPALVFDARLTDVAETHARDMVTRGYFGHDSPDGETLENRLERAAYAFTAAGENLAQADSEASAHSALWNSPGHRENMLDRDFAHVGIAALPAGWGLMFVEEFAD